MTDGPGMLLSLNSRMRLGEQREGGEGIEKHEIDLVEPWQCYLSFRTLENCKPAESFQNKIII